MDLVFLDECIWRGELLLLVRRFGVHVRVTKIAYAPPSLRSVAAIILHVSTSPRE